MAAQARGYAPRMDSLLALLTIPGNWLLRLALHANGVQEAALSETLAPWLGAVFWLTLILIIRSAPPLARLLRGETIPRPAQQDHSATTMPRLPIPSGGTLWGAMWRAQIVHLVLYLGFPLIWEAGRWTLIAMLLPLMIIGFGDTTLARTDGTLDHMARPACWTFAGPCSGPSSAFLYTPVIDLSQCQRDICPPGEPALRDFGGWGWKALWLVISLIWIWRWRRKLAKPAAERSG